MLGLKQHSQWIEQKDHKKGKTDSWIISIEREEWKVPSKNVRDQVWKQLLALKEKYGDTHE